MPRVDRVPAIVAAAALWTFGTPPLQASGQEAQTPGERLEVHSIELANGLKLLVLPRAGAPVASFVVQYRVGSLHERAGSTGTAHLLEHLLFKGTTSIGTTDIEKERLLLTQIDAAHDSLIALDGTINSSPLTDRLRARIDSLEDRARAFVIPNEYSRILTDEGARGLNATTTDEATTYFVELPANRIELWFAMEADRFTNPVFREFFAERDVVLEERLFRVDNSPSGTLYERHLAHAFTVHPYGLPVIGYEADVRALTRRQIRDYYDRHYGPNNAVVAVVGDVDPDHVEALARLYLEPIPPGPPVPPVRVREPEPRGERRITVHFDAEPQLRIGWRVPPATDSVTPALNTIAALLTGGRTSRLYRSLVTERQLATSVTASLGPGELHPRLFEISAVPRAPHTLEEVEEAIYEEVSRLATEGPDPVELERVRTQLRAGDVRRLESNLGLAFQLAHSTALYGDWRSTFRASARVQSVTPREVQQVTARLFTQERRTVTLLARPDESDAP